MKRYNNEPFIYDINQSNIEMALGIKLRSIMDAPFMILCIGTDRCIGDCLGPLVGHNLIKMGAQFPVYGTIYNPIHAVNLNDSIKDVKSKYPHHRIIAIDASLGNTKSVGTIQFREGPIYPGKGVGKKLPPVGNYSIIGVVDSIDMFNNTNIHQVRLSLVMEMSDIITQSIRLAIQKTAIC
ncbi:MAG: spore protease YyaC [Eubacteriales bacterium]